MCLLVLCSQPGPSDFLAAYWRHVLGQWADMETAAVISWMSSRASSTTSGNTKKK